MPEDMEFFRPYDFFVSFASISRKKLDTLLYGVDPFNAYALKMNLETCIKNYKIVTGIAERLLDLKSNRKMFDDLKTEYKYHNQKSLDNAYTNSINYIGRFYHGIAYDFLESLENGGSPDSIYSYEEEFNSMLEYFVSSYGEVKEGRYLPVLKIII